MNFLKMAQDVRHLVGVQGTGPSTVTTTAYDRVFVTSVYNMWMDIQTSKKKWKWMRATKSFIMTIGKNSYTPAEIFGPVNRFKKWYTDFVYVLKDGKNQTLRFVNYDTFVYKHINDTTNTTIDEFTVRPSDCALLFSKPDSAYTITIDYHKTAQELVLATDIPEFPSDYHKIIVYGAVASYSVSMSLPGIYQEYSQKYTEAYDQLVREQVPREIFKISGIA